MIVVIINENVRGTASIITWGFCCEICHIFLSRYYMNGSVNAEAFLRTKVIQWTTSEETSSVWVLFKIAVTFRKFLINYTSLYTHTYTATKQPPWFRYETLVLVKSENFATKTLNSGGGTCKASVLRLNLRTSAISYNKFAGSPKSVPFQHRAPQNDTVSTYPLAPTKTSKDSDAVSTAGTRSLVAVASINVRVLQTYLHLHGPSNCVALQGEL